MIKFSIQLTYFFNTKLELFSEDKLSSSSMVKHEINWCLQTRDQNMTSLINDHRASFVALLMKDQNFFNFLCFSNNLGCLLIKEFSSLSSHRRLWVIVNYLNIEHSIEPFIFSQTLPSQFLKALTSKDLILDFWVNG